MRFVFAGALAVGLIAAAGSDAFAAKVCSDDAQVQAGRLAVEQNEGCPTSGRGPFLKRAKKLLKTAVSDKACRRDAMKAISNSLCGRSESFVVCCKKKGKKIGRIVKGEAKCKKGGEACTTTSRTPIVSSAETVFLSSVDDVCTESGRCATTTTTTTTTTTSSTTTVVPTTTVPTTTLPCPAATGTLDLQIDYAATPKTNPCGRVTSDAAGTTQIATLHCGGLNIGGGNALAPPEGPTPDGSISRFGVANCQANTCDVVCVDSTTPRPAGVDCSNQGCPFGTPLPIFGSPQTCVVNTFHAAPSGQIDVSTGTTSNLSVVLSSNNFLSTGAYVARRMGSLDPVPCPVCVDSVDPTTGFNPVAGTPASPATGVCSAGARATQACTSRNSDGLSADCLPGGTEDDTSTTPPTPNPCLPMNLPETTYDDSSCLDVLGQTIGNLGSITVDLSPLKTTEVSRTAADGKICADVGQQGAGCFGAELTNQMASGANCKGIFAEGSPFGNLTDGLPHAGVLASVFCIPQTGNGIVDLSANLPGPGEVTLPGLLTLTMP